jgi:hypothetical protein
MKTHILDCPKSGRSGDVVFFMIRNRQRERAYVIPKTVRNAATKRARTVFGALSKAYSTLLTAEQQAAWSVAAAKVLSRPRLGQCGPLTGQEHFVEINSSRARIDRDWLPWPPAPVVFAPNPVEALSLRYVDGRLRLGLKLSGPAVDDIMVFAQAPCSPGRKKWRHGTCLGLLPVPQNGISDITEMYLEAFGEPEPGRKVFIRTRQQRDGWEGQSKDLSELVPVNPLPAHSGAGVSPAHFPLPKPCRTQVAALPVGRLSILSPPVCMPRRHPMPVPCTRERHATSTGVLPVQCPSDADYPSRRRKVAPLRWPRPLPERRRTGHWRELWHGG